MSARALFFAHLILFLSVFLVGAVPATAVTINVGDIIVADDCYGLVRVDPVTGAQTLISTGSIFAGVWDPYDVAILANGDLITTGFASGVTRVNPETGEQTTISQGGLLISAAGIAIAPNGDFFTVNHNENNVVRVNPASGAQTLVSSGGDLYGPLGIVIDSNGDLIITSYFNSQIVRVNPVTGDQSLLSSLLYPSAITYGPNGDLLVYSEWQGFYQINPATGLTTSIPTNLALGPVWGIEREANGNIVGVTGGGIGGGAKAVVRVNPATGDVTFLSQFNLLCSPTGIAVAGVTGIPPVAGNQPPVANAGPDQTVHVGASVTLDGSGSSDPDGNTPLSFAWGIILKPQGSTATLSDPTVSMPSFTPDVMGDYTVQLVVTDSLGAASAPDTVKISTFNSTPVADAGPDQLIIRIGSTVQLDGSNSYDLDGDNITYSWSLIQKPQGSVATLSNPAIANPTFVADYQGDYVASLVVTDSFGAASAPDTVTVSFTNVKPVANAGGNQAVAVGQAVFLSGSGSTDANGDTLSYNWSLVSRPAGSLAGLANLTDVNTSFVADIPGIYVVSLVVNDGFVNSDPASVTITATSTVNEVVQKLGGAINTINALAPSVFKNPNMGNALTNKLNAVLAEVDQGRYQEAIDKLQNDILAKTDGCALTGAPDKNDWIKECTSQGQVYPWIIQAINLLKSLI